jgi:hypothetical protein
MSRPAGACTASTSCRAGSPCSAPQHKSAVADAPNALKANYRDMQAQIQQAQQYVEYYDREFRRQQSP